MAASAAALALISIHSSHTGRDAWEVNPKRYPEISIHSSHTGRDPMGKSVNVRPKDFNPLFPYGERRNRAAVKHAIAQISIHSSHTGRDVCVNDNSPVQGISIHSSHTGRDSAFLRRFVCQQFQSTLPIRGETNLTDSATNVAKFQSTLPIRGETGRAQQ